MKIRNKTRRSCFEFLNMPTQKQHKRNPLHYLLRSGGSGGCGGSGARCRTFGTLGDADTEAIVESSGDVLEVLHASGTGGLSSLGLLGPVVCGNSCEPGSHHANEGPVFFLQTNFNSPYTPYTLLMYTSYPYFQYHPPTE